MQIVNMNMYHDRCTALGTILEMEVTWGTETSGGQGVATYTITQEALKAFLEDPAAKNRSAVDTLAYLRAEDIEESEDYMADDIAAEVEKKPKARSLEAFL